MLNNPPGNAIRSAEPKSDYILVPRPFILSIVVGFLCRFCLFDFCPGQVKV